MNAGWAVINVTVSLFLVTVIRSIVQEIKRDG